MRSILGLVLLLAPGPARSTEREARTELLTYDEMMQLAPEARVAYVRDFARLLALMEKQFEAKYDGATAAMYRERRARVAVLMDAFGLPEADAADGAAPADTTETTGSNATGSYATPPTDGIHRRPRGRFRHNAEGVYPRGDQTPTARAAAESSAVEAPAAATQATSVQKVGAPSAATPPAGGAPAAPAGTTTPPREEAPAAGPKTNWENPPAKAPADLKYEAPKKKVEMPPEVKMSCDTKPPTCQKISAEERKKLLIDFRKGPDTECVAGAFFTKKRMGAKAGSCEVIRSLKFGDRKVDCKDAHGRVTDGDALCNPFPFCITYPDVQVMRNKKSVTADMPITFCVKSGQDITERCMAKYDQIVKTGRDQHTIDIFKTTHPKVAAQLKKAVACDGTFNNVDAPIADVYRDLREKTIASYKQHCLSTQGFFGQLFCKECGLVYQQIHTMLANAGHACDAPGDAGPMGNPSRKYEMPGGAESTR